MKKFILNEKDLNKKVQYIWRFNEHEAKCSKYFCSWDDVFIFWDNIVISSYGDNDGYAYRGEWEEFIPIKYFKTSVWKINAWKRLKKEGVNFDIDFNELEEISLEYNGEEATKGVSCDPTDESREFYFHKIIELFSSNNSNKEITEKKEQLEEQGFEFLSSEKIKEEIEENLPSGFLKIEKQDKEEVSFCVSYKFFGQNILKIEDKKITKPWFSAKYVYVWVDELKKLAKDDEFYIYDFYAEKYIYKKNIEIETKTEKYTLPFKVTNSYIIETDDERALPFLSFERSGGGKSLYWVFMGQTIQLSKRIMESFLSSDGYENRKTYFRDLKKYLIIFQKRIFGIIRKKYNILYILYKKTYGTFTFVL